MIDKITEIFGNVSNEDYKSFNDKINSIINFTRTTENVSRDFSWVPIVEETIPYLDTIIRNPKKFLQQEEDIVIVEKGLGGMLDAERLPKANKRNFWHI